MLVDFVETITELLQNILSAFGPGGVMVIAFAENLFPPTPSEFLYPLAGKLAFDGEMTPAVVIAAGVLGSMIGAVIYYGLGYKLGDQRVRAFIERRGRLKIGRFGVQVFTVDEYDRAMMLFRRHGGIVVCVGRLMPLVHGIVSIPAGVVGMNFPVFMFYTALGAFLWIMPLTLLGYWLGDNWDRMLYWLDIYENIWYVLMAVALVAYIYYRFRRARNNRHQVEIE